MDNLYQSVSSRAWPQMLLHLTAERYHAYVLYVCGEAGCPHPIQVPEGELFQVGRCMQDITYVQQVIRQVQDWILASDPSSILVLPSQRRAFLGGSLHARHYLGPTSQMTSARLDICIQSKFYFSTPLIKVSFSRHEKCTIGFPHPTKFHFSAPLIKASFSR